MGRLHFGTARSGRRTAPWLQSVRIDQLASTSRLSPAEIIDLELSWTCFCLGILLGSQRARPAGRDFINRDRRKCSSPPAAFTTTHWSVVLEARGESPAAQEALENLCRTYWRPIYSFVRREGIGPEEAKDLTQGFFALILERKDFQSVRQEKGRLRSFLLASLKHFMANERRDARTIKRGGGRMLIPFDEIASDDSTEFDRSEMLSPDLLYDRRWALTVLERVFARLREESQRSANAPLLERLNELLSDEPNRPSQAEIAREFGMTENAVKQAFHRLRQRYRQLLREEVAQTVATPAEIEDELRHLIAALRS